MIAPKRRFQRVVAAAIFVGVAAAQAAEPGLITKPSDYPPRQTIERFEAAVRAKEANGWIVFAELDHAAAAAKAGLSLKPRTVVVFGNPRLGTTPMQGAPTLAIDVPLKALVWEDNLGKVWLSYNSGDYLRDYVYPRHGLAMPADAAKTLDQVLAGFAEAATK